MIAPRAPGTALLLGLCAPERGLRPRASVDECARALADGERRHGQANRGDAFGLCVLAERHKVTGLLARAVARCAADDPAVAALFPEPARDRLRLNAAAGKAFRALLLGEWQRMESALRKAGIPALVVKGPSLSLELYGDPLEREYRDIDLVVRASDLSAAAGILSSMEYEETAAEDFSALPARRRAWVQSTSHHRAFKKRNRPFFFELHGVAGESIGLAPISIDDAFARSVRLERDGIAFPTLCRDDHALTALLHAARHQWCTLQWMFDSAVILADESILITSETAPSWRGEDIALSAGAFALVAENHFEGAWTARGRPRSARELGRRRKLAAFAEKLLTGDNPEGGMYRRALHELDFRTRISGKAHPRLSALRAFLRPSPLDLRAFRTTDLPLAFFYLARPFLLLSRVARSRIGRRRA